MIREWLSEWVSEWVSDWVIEWVSEWVSECVGGWVSEWVSERVSENIVVKNLPDWKFMASIARNANFKGSQDQIFARFLSKMAKTDYFQ